MAGNPFSVTSGCGVDGADLAYGPASRAIHHAERHGLPPLSVGVTTESPFSPSWTSPSRRRRRRRWRRPWLGC
ncbi:hypothetical protein [Nesterenkonia pannonica]|uniref:hypothetical protein n=1 Tax=Nesterenkonia pannonica TaxID=1548602 RepID=UPI00216464C8|nr:hypothetical protein [Nesterenkonia pannonica]